jgi:hypothetical protein
VWSELSVLRDVQEIREVSESRTIAYRELADLQESALTLVHQLERQRVFKIGMNSRLFFNGGACGTCIIFR